MKKSSKLTLLVLKIVFEIAAAAFLIYAFVLFREMIDVVLYADEEVKEKIITKNLATIFNHAGRGVVFVGFSLFVNSFLSQNDPKGEDK
jgi:hypothetical protein